VTAAARALGGYKGRAGGHILIQSGGVAYWVGGKTLHVWGAELRGLCRKARPARDRFYKGEQKRESVMESTREAGVERRRPPNASFESKRAMEAKTRYYHFFGENRETPPANSRSVAQEARPTSRRGVERRGSPVV